MKRTNQTCMKPVAVSCSVAAQPVSPSAFYSHSQLLSIRSPLLVVATTVRHSSKVRLLSSAWPLCPSASQWETLLQASNSSTKLRKPCAVRPVPLDTINRPFSTWSSSKVFCAACKAFLLPPQARRPSEQYNFVAWPVMYPWTIFYGKRRNSSPF